MTFKKSVFALAVAGALGLSVVPSMVSAAAHGDAPVVYGSVRLDLVYASDKDGLILDPGTDGMDIVDNSSRLGVHGTEDIGNGLGIVYRYELGIDAATMTVADNNRLSYAGLKGDFGEVTMGRHWSPYYEAVVAPYYDYFETIGCDLWVVCSSGNATISIRTSDSIKYSNTFGPMSLGALIVVSDATDDEDIDRTEIAANFNFGQFTFGVGYSGDAASFGDDSATGAGGSFQFGKSGPKITLGYESYDPGDGPLANADDDSVESLALGVEFPLGGGHLVRALYDETSQGDTELSQILLGYRYSLSRRTTLHVEYEQDMDDSSGATADDATALALGFKANF